MNRLNSYLDPRWPIGIAPAADNQIEHIGPCCLDVNDKSAYIMKGRGGGAWWMIWMAVMMIDLGFVGLFLASSLAAGIAAFFTIAILSISAFGLSLLWPIHVWRTHLPMRFNRKTRKVYFHHKGKIYVSDWDTIRAYLKVQGGMTPQGVPLADPQVNVEFDDGRGSTITVFLMGTDKSGLYPYQKAAALWEYIRRYMEEGPEQLPQPECAIRQSVTIPEAFREHFFLPLFKWTWWPWARPIELLIFPLRVVWFLLWFPTDVLYYHLARRIKMKPYPPEMVEACACEEAETTDVDEQTNAKEVMAS